MVVVDIRNVFAVRNVEIIEINDDFIYYAEEKRKKATTTFFYWNITGCLNGSGW